MTRFLSLSNLFGGTYGERSTSGRHCEEAEPTWQSRGTLERSIPGLPRRSSPSQSSGSELLAMTDKNSLFFRRFVRTIFSPLIFCFIFSSPILANHPLTFSQFFQAVPEASNIKSSPDSSTLIGKKFTHNGQKYEIRALGFEDTQNKLPKNATFQQYITMKGLLDKPSTSSTSYALEFESFRYQTMDLDDGVYFLLALKHHPD